MNGKEKTFRAPTDIYHDSESVILTMEMPGVPKNSLEIKVDGDILIIHGTKADVRAEGQYRVSEIRKGDYHQEYTLDDTVDRNKIDAVIKNGLVTLTLGLKESEKPKKISISVQ